MGWENFGAMHDKKLRVVNFRRGFSVALLVVLTDQVTKFIANDTLQYGVEKNITDWFDFRLAYNTGAAFSLLADAGGWQRWGLSALAIFISIFLVHWLRTLGPHQNLLSIALGMILGGGVGNLIDRLSFGYVVDFISLHYAGWYWPTFNIADTAITIGAILLIWDSISRVPEGVGGAK